MKNLYFIIALLLSGSAFSQNYRAYVPERPAYFHSNTGANSWFFESTRAIAEDTVWTNGTHRIVKSFREEIASGSSFTPCFAFDTSWVGTHIVQDTVSGETWFFNYEGDTIRFIASATTGQTGMYCRMANGTVMRAVVASTGQMGVMTVSDSVRIMIMNLEDAAGNPLTHALNGKPLIVSKQFGLVRTYAWSDFPIDTTSYTLSGMENPVVGQRIITGAQIFDYNVGDRFDWYTVQNTFNPAPGPSVYDYYSITITNKVVNGDTVTYDFIQDYAHKVNNTVTSQSWGLPSSMVIIFSLEDGYYELPHRPFDMLGEPDSTHNAMNYFGYATMPYAPTEVNGRQLKGHYNGNPYTWDSTQQCFNGVTVSFGPCDGIHNVWGDGIGKVYAYAGSVTCSNVYRLVYFEKGAETWGTPHNWSVLLSSPEADAVQQEVNVWPNPSEDVINVNLPAAASGPLTYQIYNSCGQLVSSGASASAAGVLQVPVIQLASGIYQVVITGEQYSWRATFAH